MNALEKLRTNLKEVQQWKKDKSGDPKHLRGMEDAYTVAIVLLESNAKPVESALEILNDLRSLANRARNEYDHSYGRRMGFLGA